MVPKFANPHSLAQDVEVTTRSEIAQRTGSSRATCDEDSTLKRDLDNLLRDTWADALAGIPSPPSAKRCRKTTASNCQPGEDKLVFRLVSSMKRPQRISLDPKPPPQPVSREPDCEDDEIQAQIRWMRAQSVAVELESLRGSSQINPKCIAVGTKVPVKHTSLPGPLPSLLVTEEVRTATRVKPRRQASESATASPHEPRPSCAVLPVLSCPIDKQTPKKERRKATKQRPVPAYWRPSPDMQGKCMGYALGYPSSWVPDRLYVRDVMKRG